MNNGVYQYAIKMTSPIGPRYGTLELDILSGAVKGGFLTMFSKKLPISGGDCRDGVLRFSGRMETLLYPLPYTAEGTLSEQAVQVIFNTEKGRFPAEGAAVTDRDKEISAL